jgi:hypothetical protein
MDKVSDVVTAFGPAFAAGFAIQRLLELLDPLFPFKDSPDRKKKILGIVSLLCGLALAGGMGIRIIRHLITPDAAGWFDALDAFVTALVISAGTEGLNSIIKFLGYAKAEKKAEATFAGGATPPPGT